MITLDTNVLVYLMDDSEPTKQDIAAEVIGAVAARGGPIALQVVGEMQNAAIRKLKMPPFIVAQAARNVLSTFPTIGSTAADAEIALGQMASGRLSYWDALLLSSIRRAGCSTLLTEDMQDGSTQLGVRIINPFTGEGLSQAARDALNA